MGQSEISFSIQGVFEILMTLSYRLSMALIPNLRSDFSYDWPLVSKIDQSEISFFILGFFELLIIFWYRLSTVMNPKVQSDFWSHWPLVSENGPIRNKLFSLDWRKGHMKKNAFVCVLVPNQDFFHLGLQPIRFQHTGFFPSQDFFRLGLQTIRYQHTGFFPSQDFFRLGYQPIRLQHTWISANQVPAYWVFPNRVFFV